MMGNDNRLCPGICPNSCPEGSFPCGGIDFNGCPLPTMCMPYSSKFARAYTIGIQFTDCKPIKLALRIRKELEK
jgi:hypothetical protein